MLTDYLDGLAVGARRWNNVRASIAGLFRWARTMGKLPDTITAPEKVHARRVEDKPVGIYTPKQFIALLACTDEDFRLAVAIGGLAGLRSEEIHQLRWEDLKLDRNLIEVRAATVKTGKRRLVPILPALAAWIAVSEPQEGNMVAPRLSFSVLQKRLKRHHGIKWIHNGLRHSYGTYRCAVLTDIAAVSYALGNSPSMVKMHYLEMQEEAAGKAWFEVMPGIRTFEKATTK
jgi:integrase